MVPNNGESNGKENGKRNGSWDYIDLTAVNPLVPNCRGAKAKSLILNLREPHYSSFHFLFLDPIV